ncbi:MAG: OmpA family protein [Bacteroidota bacterium]
MRYLVFLSTILVCQISYTQDLPLNPDPNQCYVRTVTPYEYEIWYEDHLTYTEEEAAMYPHERIEYVHSRERSSWEYRTDPNCKSQNPLDCRILCLKEEPEKVEVIYKPIHDSLGSPKYVELEFVELINEGGLAAWEQIDCELVNYNELPIHFENKSVNLKYNERHIIDDNLLELLLNHPNINLEIAAHTDSRGSADRNLEITMQRAEAVIDYLVSEGINRQRLVARGYGEIRLKNKCADGVPCSEREHAQNNRIEFRVMNSE